MIDKRIIEIGKKINTEYQFYKFMKQGINGSIATRIINIWTSVTTLYFNGLIDRTEYGYLRCACEDVLIEFDIE